MLTSVSVGSFSDVYTTLPDGLGLKLGMVVQEPNTFNFKQLVQHDAGASASLPVDAACQWEYAATESYICLCTTNTGEIIIGSNDNAGVVIPPGSYFWLSVKGFCNMLGAASISGAGVFLGATATDGVVDELVETGSGALKQANIVAQEGTTTAASIRVQIL